MTQKFKFNKKFQRSRNKKEDLKNQKMSSKRLERMGNSKRKRSNQKESLIAKINNEQIIYNKIYYYINKF